MASTKSKQRTKAELTPIRIARTAKRRWAVVREQRRQLRAAVRNQAEVTRLAARLRALLQASEGQVAELVHEQARRLGLAAVSAVAFEQLKTDSILGVKRNLELMDTVAALQLKVEQLVDAKRIGFDRACNLVGETIARGIFDEAEQEARDALPAGEPADAVGSHA